MPSVQSTTSRDNFRGELYLQNVRFKFQEHSMLNILILFSLLQKIKRLRATDVWFKDMLEIGCNYSILNHKRINYKICFVFQRVDNTGVFYKSRDNVVPSKYKDNTFSHIK